MASLDSEDADLNEIAGIIQRKYGIAREEACEALNEMIARHRAETKEKHAAGEDLIESEDRDSAPARIRDQYHQI